MRLTLSTDYALRTLIYLGFNAQKLSTISEIAQRYAISRGHLMKVVHRLGQQGYVETVRGKGGGLRLRRAAAEIRIGQVVRDTEDDLCIMGCLAATGFCRIERCCVLRELLRSATAAFLETLDQHTLADLLRPRSRLGRAFAIESVTAMAAQRVRGV